MDLKKIKELVKIIDESSLEEFTYREGDVEITMCKKIPGAEPAMPPMPPMMPMAMGMGGFPAAPAAPVAAPAPAAPAEVEEEELFITSPIVGTFYSAAAPDVPAYVKVGDQVKNGQTVCILEAMKLMNEIQAEYNCEIVAVLVSNEQKVEYGQPLFKVKKL